MLAEPPLEKMPSKQTVALQGTIRRLIYRLAHLPMQTKSFSLPTVEVVGAVLLHPLVELVEVGVVLVVAEGPQMVATPP